MAIEIKTLSRPKIRLVGHILGSGGIWSDIISDNKVDDYKRVEGTSVISTTHLDKSNVITFNNQVRIIITGQITPKPTYQRESGRFNSLTFEGGVRSSSASNVFAETYYTLNNKNPIRTAAYLYKYTDMDDYIVDTDKNVEHTPPFTDISSGDIDPSFDITTITSSNNLETLGFILKIPPTGTDNFVLKARTFYQGRQSTIAEVYFKIVQKNIDLVLDNEDSNT